MKLELFPIRIKITWFIFLLSVCMCIVPASLSEVHPIFFHFRIFPFGFRSNTDSFHVSTILFLTIPKNRFRWVLIGKNSMQANEERKKMKKKRRNWDRKHFIPHTVNLEMSSMLFSEVEKASQQQWQPQKWFNIHKWVRISVNACKSTYKWFQHTTLYVLSSHLTRPFYCLMHRKIL